MDTTTDDGRWHSEPFDEDTDPQPPVDDGHEPVDDNDGTDGVHVADDPGDEEDGTDG